MAQHTAFIVPHRLNFGSGFGRTPSRAGKQLHQTVWESKTGTISEIHFAKGGKELIRTHVLGLGLWPALGGSYPEEKPARAYSCVDESLQATLPPAPPPASLSLPIAPMLCGRHSRSQR